MPFDASVNPKTIKAKPGQFTSMISSTALDLSDHRAAVREAFAPAA